MKRKRFSETIDFDEKMDSLNRLARNIAHDFNNVLTGLQGNLELASDKIGDNHPAAYNLNNMLKIINIGKELTACLLEMGHKRPYILKPLNLKLVIQKAISEIDMPNDSCNIMLSFNPIVPLITADEERIRTVLKHLILNALEAASYQGTIEICLEHQKIGGKEQGDTMDKESFAVITFRDTGDGIAEEIQHKVFEPFFSTRKKSKLAGLGLPISYFIVASHGGFMKLRRQEGIGTEVKVFLPAAHHDAESHKVAL
jgi:signal transduction histidine kinase